MIDVQNYINEIAEIFHIMRKKKNRKKKTVCDSSFVGYMDYMCMIIVAHMSLTLLHSERPKLLVEFWLF